MDYAHWMSIVHLLKQPLVVKHDRQPGDKEQAQDGNQGTVALQKLPPFILRDQRDHLCT